MNTLLYKNMYFSHFILKRVDVSVGCVWEMGGDRDRLLYWSNFSNECPGYDTKLFDGEAPVMLEILGI